MTVMYMYMYLVQTKTESIMDLDNEIGRNIQGHVEKQGTGEQEPDDQIVINLNPY